MTTSNIIEKLIIYSPLLITLACLIIVAYGTFYENFAEKNYDWVKKMTPHFLWIKNKNTYVIYSKVTIVILMILVLFRIILSLMGIWP